MKLVFGKPNLIPQGRDGAGDLVMISYPYKLIPTQKESIAEEENETKEFEIKVYIEGQNLAEWKFNLWETRETPINNLMIRVLPYVISDISERHKGKKLEHSYTIQLHSPLSSVENKFSFGKLDRVQGYEIILTHTK